MRPGARVTHPALLGIVLVAGAIFIGQVAAPSPVGAQLLTDRTPNLEGGWVGTPGSLHFHFDHRFWLLGERVFNSPSFLLAVPLPGRLLAGGRYASNSRVSGASTNEWELLGRWAASPEAWPLEMALTGAYNVHPGSVDGEISVSAPVRRATVLGAARGFSNALDTGEPGWFLGAGAVLPIHRLWSVGADVGTMRVDGEALRRAWGASLQLLIPTTPHSLSLKVGNTRTGSLQGSSVGTRTTWGFEFTIPVTFARYFRGSPPGASARDATEEAPDGDVEREISPRETVEITMTDDLRFAPEEIRIRAGQTVLWRNTTPVLHTVTADPAAVRDARQVLLPPGAEPFDSGFMFENDEFRHTFTVPGEYVYICVPHDTAPMVGRIVVEPEP